MEFWVWGSRNRSHCTMNERKKRGRKRQREKGEVEREKMPGQKS